MRTKIFIRGNVLARARREISALKKIDLSSLAKAAKDIEADLLTKFNREKDPYGAPWKKRKHRYPWRINDRTGNLKRSFRFSVSNRKNFRVENVAPYSGFVHRGTIYSSPRPILPTTRRGLPSPWREAFKRVLRDYITKTITKGKKP